MRTRDTRQNEEASWPFLGSKDSLGTVPYGLVEGGVGIVVRDHVHAHAAQKLGCGSRRIQSTPRTVFGQLSSAWRT
jgi:hypothetical protein